MLRLGPWFGGQPAPRNQETYAAGCHPGAAGFLFGPQLQPDDTDGPMDTLPLVCSAARRVSGRQAHRLILHEPPVDLWLVFVEPVNSEAALEEICSSRPLWTSDQQTAIPRKPKSPVDQGCPPLRPQGTGTRDTKLQGRCPIERFLSFLRASSMAWDWCRGRLETVSETNCSSLRDRAQSWSGASFFWSPITLGAARPLIAISGFSRSIDWSSFENPERA